MVNRIFFWTSFGFLTRWWQMGIEMRPFFEKKALIAYPIYMAAGAGFGYWLQGVDERQTEVLQGRKHRLLEKRARKAERDAERAAAAAEA